MTEFLAVSWYLVPAIVLALVSLVAFIIAVIAFFATYDRADKEFIAKFALSAFGMLVFGSWIWPVVVPVAVLFALFKLVGEIIPSKKEN